MYSIWVLEYGHVYGAARGALLSGQFNGSSCELSYSYTLLRGEGHTVLIDTGSNGFDDTTKRYHQRDGVKHWQPPEKILAKTGVTPEEVDTVLLTHAHYDHMDNLAAFPNAEFYLQERELLGWIWAMTREKRFRFPLAALKTQNVYEALKLAEDGRMHLVNGETKDILPGIDLYPAFDGHTFGSQIVAVRNGEDVFAFTGDAAYLRENLTGFDGSGQYIPIGMASGDPYHQMETFDLIEKLVKGVEKNIIIGHSPEVYEMYPSKKYDDLLCVAEISLAGGHASVL